MALDFNTLTPETATIKPKNSGRVATEIPAQVLQWLEQSYDNPMGIPVEAKDVKEFVALLNRGATKLDLGVRIRVVDSKKQEFVPNADLYDQLEGKSNKMRVVWATKARTKRARKTVAVDTAE